MQHFDEKLMGLLKNTLTGGIDILFADALEDRLSEEERFAGALPALKEAARRKHWDIFLQIQKGVKLSNGELGRRLRAQAWEIACEKNLETLVAPLVEEAVSAGHSAEELGEMAFQTVNFSSQKIEGWIKKGLYRKANAVDALLSSPALNLERHADLLARDALALMADNALARLLPLVSQEWAARTNERGETALITAAKKASEEGTACVKLLLSVSDANVQEKDGFTALAIAIDNSQAADGTCWTKSVDALLPHTDLALKTEDGLTALACAVFTGYAGWRDLLAGSDLGARTKRGRTVAMMAAIGDKLEIVEELCQIQPMEPEDATEVMAIGENDSDWRLVDWAAQHAPMENVMATAARAPAGALPKAAARLAQEEASLLQAVAGQAALEANPTQATTAASNQQQPANPAQKTKAARL